MDMSKGKKTPKPSSTADLSNWDDALIKDQLGSVRSLLLQCSGIVFGTGVIGRLETVRGDC